MGDIQKMIDVAQEKGFVVNKALTSLKMINYMRNNTAMQTAVLGAANKRLLTKQELANLLMQEYEITVDRCDEKYRYRKDGAWENLDVSLKKTYLPCMKLTRMVLSVLDFGGQHQRKRKQELLSHSKTECLLLCAMWATQDPVTTWTKASGMFIRSHQKLTVVS